MDDNLKFQLLKKRYKSYVSDITLLKQYHMRYGNEALIDLLMSHNIKEPVEKIPEQLAFDFKSYGNVTQIMTKEYQFIPGWIKKGPNVVYVSTSEGEVRHTMGFRTAAKFPNTVEHLLIYADASCLTKGCVDWNMLKQHINRIEFVEPCGPPMIRNIMDSLKSMIYEEKINDCGEDTEKAIVLVSDIIINSPKCDRHTIPYGADSLELIMRYVVEDSTIFNGVKKLNKGEKSFDIFITNLISPRSIYIGASNNDRDGVERKSKNIYNNYHLMRQLIILINSNLRNSYGYIKYKGDGEEFTVDSMELFNFLEILNAFPDKKFEYHIVFGSESINKNLSDYYFLLRQAIEINDNLVDL